MEHNSARLKAYNAAELKAGSVAETCGPAPIDHAAQAALENTDLTGDEFNEVYDEVGMSVHRLTNKYNPSKAAKKLQRLKYELHY